MDSSDLAQKKQKFFEILKKEDSNVTEKYKALFELKTLGGEDSADLLVQGTSILHFFNIFKPSLILENQSY